MAFSAQIIADIKKRNIEVTDKDLAEFERQNINSDEDIDAIIEKLPAIIHELRKLSPVWPVKA